MSFKEVITDGKNDLPQKDPVKARKGIFWGYDGSNKIGVPPRLYNQFVRSIDGFSELTAAVLMMPTEAHSTAAEMEALLKKIKVSFVSDEFNGVTTDNTGVVRPKFKREFNLFDAIVENNQSRIYLGVHWQFDAEGGEKVGTAIANKVIAEFK